MGAAKMAGERYACGRLKRPARAARAAQVDETAFVRNQPHRRGERSQMAASPLGRFVMAFRMDAEAYDAGLAYGQLRRRICGVWGAPALERGEGAGGDPVTIERALDWIERAYELEEAMVRAGGHMGRIGVTRLTVDELPLPPGEMEAAAKRSLRALVLALYGKRR